MVKKFQLWKVKIFLIILLTFTYSNIILWGAPASQSLQLRYGGKDITYTSPPTTLKIDGQTIIPGAMPPVIIDGRTLVPVREVFEQLGASVGWDDHTQEITIIWEDKFIVLQVDNPMAMVNDNVQTMDVPPKLITNKELNITKTMVPFRFITETFGFENIWDPENYIVNAISPQVTIPKPEEQDPEIPNPEVIDPKEENLEDKEPNQQGEFDIVIPDQAIIPPSPPVIREEHPTTAITKVEVPQKIQGNAEIKIHGTGPITYFEHHIWSGKIVIDIANANMNLSNLNQLTQGNPLIKKITSSQYKTDITRVVFEFYQDQTQYYIEFGDDRKTINIQLYPNVIHHIAAQNEGTYDALYIAGSWSPDAEISRLSFPNRLVVDLPYTINQLHGLEQQIEGKYIQGIRTSQFTDTTTRIVLDLKEQGDYEIQKQGQNGIVIYMIAPTYKNIEYEHSGIVQLKLKKDLNKPFVSSQIFTDDQYINNKYIVRLPGDYTDIYGYGTMKINDGILDSIQIEKNTVGQTELIFNQKKISAYTITEDVDYLYINIIKPGDIYKQIVVIDAGHGGSDPGAGANGIREKDINLDISLRLWQHLLQNPSIKVYMTRTTDIYPTLQERVQLAEDVGADLFISIHNNAAGSANAKGTEVLYNPDNKQYQSNLTNKQLAQTLQKHLISQLGTHNRGVIPRPDLYVLRNNTVPAVLVEGGFMTNPEEAARMKTDGFRAQMAQAIYDGIKEVFGQYPTQR